MPLKGCDSNFEVKSRYNCNNYLAFNNMYLDSASKL